MVSVLLTFIGIFIIIFSIGGKTDNVSGSGLIKTDTNLYSNTLNKDGFNVVYSD